MDTIPTPFPPTRLLHTLGSARAPLVVDVRRRPVFEAASTLIAGATWRDPAAVAEWARFMPRHRDVVVYCVHGHEVSRNTAAALAAEGIDAHYLDGGIEDWTGPTLARVAPIPAPPNAPTRWVTRERPKVDRIACPWLIRRFIDPTAEFLYVPAADVKRVAEETGAIPYDVAGVRFTHRGAECSFDALVADFGLAHPALTRLAAIVRGADTGAPALAPEAPGLAALSRGLSDIFDDDHAQLAAGMVMYDALYAACRARDAA